MFESVKFPGECLSVGSDGQVKLENQPLDSVHAQITIRVTVRTLILLHCQAIIESNSIL